MSAVAIFVKTPGLSPVKSRLGSAIGPAHAAECHLRCARAVAEVALSAAAGPVYWAVAEADGLDYPGWSGLPRLLQTGTGLGARMKSIHDILCRHHGAGILVGADLPQIRPEDLQRSARHLRADSRPGVLGPSSDGGFWLFGANSLLPTSAWEAPTYGGPRVVRDLQRAIGHSLNWLQLDTRTDLDEAEDLAMVTCALAGLTHRHPAQSALLEWMVHTLPKWTVEPP